MTQSNVAAPAQDPVDPDPAWWDAWRGILFAGADVLRAVEPLLQEHSGLSMTFMDVLGRLHDAPGQRMRMQELQERSLFTRSGMTRLIDRVERAGFARRERVPGDRRGVYVVLTPEGSEAFETALTKHREDVQRVFEHRLTEAQHRAVADALASFWHDE